MNSEPPLVCNMDVFTPAQRDDHIQSSARLYGSVQAIHETENGYEFTFPNGTECIKSLTEFISNERLCCPFLEFQLRIAPNEEPISLILTGPAGTQEFLREEFSEAFA